MTGFLFPEHVQFTTPWGIEKVEPEKFWFMLTNGSGTLIVKSRLCCLFEHLRLGEKEFGFCLRSFVRIDNVIVSECEVWSCEFS
jgi:hypothetical protein